MIKNNYINKIELLVRKDDKNLLEVSKVFLKDLEKCFEKFKKDHKTYCEEEKKYTKSKEYYFIPEKIIKKSPLTILNAPWGAGKTYFVENFFKLFIDKKLKSEVFKKMIIVNAWKFSDCNDVSIEFMNKLFDEILKIFPFSSPAKDKNKLVKRKLLEIIIPMSFSLNFHFLSFSWTKNLNKCVKNEAEKKIEELINNETPTIIFVDNLERLGSQAWNLLKSITKFQEFSNFLIILSLDQSQIKNNKQSENGEYPIQKYIDFNWYDFKQDYYNFLYKYLKHLNLNRTFEKVSIDISIFNKLLQKRVSQHNKTLSIRELENTLKYFDLSKTTYKFHTEWNTIVTSSYADFRYEKHLKFFYSIVKEIWDPSILWRSFIEEWLKIQRELNYY